MCLLSQEYGISKMEKLDIASAYCLPLVKKIQLDLQRTHEDEAVNKLHPLWGSGHYYSIIQTACICYWCISFISVRQWDFVVQWLYCYRGYWSSLDLRVFPMTVSYNIKCNLCVQKNSILVSKKHHRYRRVCLRCNISYGVITMKQTYSS